MGNYHAPFWRAVEEATPSLTLIVAAAQVCLNYVTSGSGTGLLNARGVQTSTPIATGGWGQVWAKKRETPSDSVNQVG